MGRRVNLADLAVDDFDAPAPPTPPAAPVAPAPRPADPDPTDRTGSADQADRADLAGDGLPQRMVPTSAVALNPLNKRPPGADEETTELAETIREHGVIQPLVVCSTARYLAEFPDQREHVEGREWVVLIGNRRLRAVRMAGLDEVPIMVNDDRVASMYEVMLIENGQRKDLPPILEAEAIAEAIKSSAISQRELARRIGRSPMYVTQRLALLKLVPELRMLLEAGELTIELAREFGELPEAEQRAIVAAGKPYRRPRANGVISRAAVRSIRVSSPSVAAESIRKTFSTEELTELVQLLSAHLTSASSTTD